jgi:hypothetical protein
MCPQLLPKKMRGRDAKEDRAEEEIMFGASKLHKTIDGIDYLKEGANVA